MTQDLLSPEERSLFMARIRGKNTKLECTVRKIVWAMGYRYRLHRADLPGKPDMVFAKYRRVIFVHGCFWHRHDCPSGRRIPKSRVAFWTKKLEGNFERDVKTERRLKELGWKVLVIWECEIKDVPALEEKIRNFMESGD